MRPHIRLRALRALAIVGVSLSLVGCPNGGYLPTDGRAKTTYMNVANFEEPLELGDRVRALEEPTPSYTSQIYFSRHSRFYVWFEGASDKPGKIWVGEVGGAKRELASYNAFPMVHGWSWDGAKVLISDLVRPRPEGSTEMIPSRALAYTLTEPSTPPQTMLTDFTSIQAGLGFLPDASGVSFIRMVGYGELMGTPTQQNRAPRQIFTQLPGQGEVLEAELGGPAGGAWSPDAQQYAYFEYRDRDVTKGLDLRVFDRRQKTSSLLNHVETDDLRLTYENLMWGSNGSVYFTLPCQEGASASIAVTESPVSGAGASLKVIAFSLGAGEQLGPVFLAPDQRHVAYEVTKRVRLRVENGGEGEVMQSQGIFIGRVADGVVQRLTPRGHVVSWLPGGRQLVCATGRADQIRHYVVDLPSEAEAQ